MLAANDLLDHVRNAHKYRQRSKQDVVDWLEACRLVDTVPSAWVQKQSGVPEWGRGWCSADGTQIELAWTPGIHAREHYNYKGFYSFNITLVSRHSKITSHGRQLAAFIMEAVSRATRLATMGSPVDPSKKLRVLIWGLGPAFDTWKAILQSFIDERMPKAVIEGMSMGISTSIVRENVVADVISRIRTADQQVNDGNTKTVPAKSEVKKPKYL